MKDAEKRARELARQIADAVNAYGFDDAAFADELCNRTHRTLQQSAFRAFGACIKEWANARDNDRYDLRNDHTTRVCFKIVAVIEEHDLTPPMV